MVGWLAGLLELVKFLSYLVGGSAGWIVERMEKRMNERTDECTCMLR